MFSILSALALLICYLTPFVDPSVYWTISFFGLAYPFVVLVNIALMAHNLLHWKKYFWISFFILLVGYPLHKNFFALNGNNHASSRHENTIRVMSYNAHFLRAGDHKPNGSAAHEVMRILKEEQPDILCIQEFYTKFKEPHNILKDILKTIRVEHFYFEEIFSNKDQAIGLIIFSKYPIENKQTLPFSKEKSLNTSIFVDVNIKGYMVRVFNVHFQSIKFAPEDYAYIKKVKDSLSSDVGSNKRFVLKLKTAFQKRAPQARLIAHQIANSPYPVILSGDFNDTPGSYTFHTVASHMQSAFTEKGRGWGSTYSGSFPNFQIDYILCDHHFQVKNYDVIKDGLSDHYPIRSDLSIKE